MASIKPVIQSELHLTECQHDPPYARYYFDTFTGDDPQSTMDVRIRGFETPGNNGQFVILNVTLPAPGNFEVALSSQLDETHEARAVAQFDYARPCNVLTQPSRQINMKYGSNNAGCTANTRNRKIKHDQGTTAPDYNDPNGKTVGWCNRRLQNTMAHYWKHNLTAGERDAWASAAIGQTWTNYKRTVTNPTGFKLWMAANRFYRSATFGPGAYGQGLFFPVEITNGYVFSIPLATPPTALESLAPPAYSIVDFYDRVDLFMSLSNDPNPYNSYLICYTTGNLDNRGTPPNTSYRDAFSQLNVIDALTYADIYLDYPYPPGTPAGNRTVGLRWYDISAQVISPATWLKV